MRLFYYILLSTRQCLFIFYNIINRTNILGEKPMEDNKQNPFSDAEKENAEEQKQQEQKDEKNDAQIEETKEEDNTSDNETDEKSELEKKYEDLNNKYIRLAADFDNFRKRTLQEKEELSKFTTVQLLNKIASVLDTFDRAQEHLKDIENCQTVKDSYEVAYKQFLDTLKKIGMEEIEAIGKAFNPNEHEAITQVPTNEFEPDTVAYVAQKGYKLDDKIIRPALVGVAKKLEDE